MNRPMADDKELETLEWACGHFHDGDSPGVDEKKRLVRRIRHEQDRAVRHRCSLEQAQMTLELVSRLVGCDETGRSLPIVERDVLIAADEARVLAMQIRKELLCDK